MKRLLKMKRMKRKLHQNRLHIKSCLYATWLNHKGSSLSSSSYSVFFFLFIRCTFHITLFDSLFFFIMSISVRFKFLFCLSIRERIKESKYKQGKRKDVSIEWNYTFSYLICYSLHHQHLIDDQKKKEKTQIKK